MLSQKLLEAWAHSTDGGKYKLRGSGFHKECIDLKAKRKKLDTANRDLSSPFSFLLISQHLY